MTTAMYEKARAAETTRREGGIAGIVGKEAGLFDDLSAAAAEQNEFVNNLREEVRAWREGGYDGTAAVTRRLLEWWFERATGTGKTVVMALIVTWSTLHKKKVSGSTSPV